MNFRKQLKSWDGKSTDDLVELYLTFSKKGSLLDSLIEYLDDDSVAVAISWLIKYCLQQGINASSSQNNQILNHFNIQAPWQTQLHLLQSLPYLAFDENQTKPIERFIRHCLTSENKFVRAWAYNGFDLLASRYPQYRKEADEFMQMAMQDEAASVKARIRNILKARK